MNCSLPCLTRNPEGSEQGRLLPYTSREKWWPLGYFFLAFHLGVYRWSLNRIHSIDIGFSIGLYSCLPNLSFARMGSCHLLVSTLSMYPAIFIRRVNHVDKWFLTNGMLAVQKMHCCWAKEFPVYLTTVTENWLPFCKSIIKIIGFLAIKNFLISSCLFSVLLQEFVIHCQVPFGFLASFHAHPCQEPLTCQMRHMHIHA